MSPGLAPRLHVGLACLLLAGVSVWLAQWTGASDAGYWIDEAISVGIASHDLADIPIVLRKDGSPPLYYLLLHEWMQLAGTGEAATRSLSLLFSVVAVPAAWWGAAGLGPPTRRAGALAAAGAACCPFLTIHAQEARMYSLVLVLSLVAAAAFVRAFVQGRREHLLTLGAALALLLYTHTWAMFLVAGMAAAWLGLRRAGKVETRDGVLLGGAVALVFAPWIPSLAFQALHTGAPWAEKPSPLFLLVVPPALVWLTRTRDDAVRVLVAIAAAGAVLAWISSQAEPAWTARYLIVLSGPLLLAAAVSLARGRRWIAVPVAAAAAIWLPAGPPPAKSNARAVATSAAVSLRPGDLVISTQPEQVPVLHRYLPRGLTYLTPLGISDDPRVADWRDALPRLRAGRAERRLVPRLRKLAPGRRIVLVTPVLGRRPPRSSWSRAVWVRTREWRAAIRSTTRLRFLGATSHPDPARFRSTVRAELFEVAR